MASETASLNQENRRGAIPVSLFPKMKRIHSPRSCTNFEKVSPCTFQSNSPGWNRLPSSTLAQTRLSPYFQHSASRGKRSRQSIEEESRLGQITGIPVNRPPEITPRHFPGLHVRSIGPDDCGQSSISKLLAISGTGASIAPFPRHLELIMTEADCWHTQLYIFSKLLPPKPGGEL